MNSILRDAGRLDAESTRACDDFFTACQVCVTTVRSAQHRKEVSLLRVNAAFNQELQADFSVVYIQSANTRGSISTTQVLVMVEQTIATTRSADIIKTIFDTRWMYHHGAPKRFSTNPEFFRSVLKLFLKEYGFVVLPRPSRSSPTNGRIERHNCVSKFIVERVSKADLKAIPNTTIFRASFLSNFVRGSKQMSVFQLVREYQPSV